MRSTYFYFVTLFVTCSTKSSTSRRSSGEAPRVKFSEYNYNPIEAKVGSNILITCPGFSEETNVWFEWFKDGQSLEENPRFKRHKFNVKTGLLRIRRVQLSDSGIYTCEVINGFGTLTLNVTLKVAGQVDEHVEQSTTMKQTTSLETDKQNHKSGTPFLVNLNQTNNITKLVGESLTLKCNALGSPKPIIRWTMNNLPLNLNQLPPGSQVNEGFLFIHNLSKRSSARYSCIAFNELGRAWADFEVTVREKEIKFNVIEESFAPMYNLSEGSNLELTCQVTSDTKPRIQWLKQKFEASKDDHHDSPVSTSTLSFLSSFSKDSISFINTSQDVVHLDGNLYQIKVKLSPIMIQDAGKYTCVIFVGTKFKSKTTIVIVNPNSVSLILNDELSSAFLTPVAFWLLAGIFLVIILILVLISSYLREKNIEQAKKQDRQKMIEGSIDAFGDPKPTRGKAINTYTLINHRPQNYYWTHGRLSHWVDEAGTRIKDQNVNRICNSCHGVKRQRKPLSRSCSNSLRVKSSFRPRQSSFCDSLSHHQSLRQIKEETIDHPVTMTPHNSLESNIV